MKTLERAMKTLTQIMGVFLLTMIAQSSNAAAATAANGND